MRLSFTTIKWSTQLDGTSRGNTEMNKTNVLVHQFPTDKEGGGLLVMLSSQKVPPLSCAHIQSLQLPLAFGCDALFNYVFHCSEYFTFIKTKAGVYTYTSYTILQV